MSNIITPVATLSYPSLFTPRAAMPGNTNQEAKYQCTLVFAPGTDLAALNEAAKACAREKWGDKGEVIYRNQKNKTLRTDGEAKGYPEGSVFMNINSKQKPGVVSKFKDPLTGKARIITDPMEMYAGCQVKVSVRPFAYDTQGNKGVSFGLQNVCKVGEGTRLDGHKAAQDEFEGQEPEAADGMDDLL